MITLLLAIAGAIHILLVIVEALLPKCRKILPLGRSHIAQLGILLGLAVALWQLVDAVRAFAGW